MTTRRLLTSQRTPAFSLLLGSIVSSLGVACDVGEPADASGGAENLGGAGGTPTATGGGGPTTGGSGGSGGAAPVVGVVVDTHELCDGESSLIDGLMPAVELDSLSFYVGATDHLCTPPDYELAATEGTACAGADDAAACEDEVERIRAGSLDWGRYEDFFSASFGLLVATGTEDAIAELGGPVDALTVEDCGSFNRGGEQWPSESSDGEGTVGGMGGAGGADSSSLSDHVTKISDRETLLTLLGAIDTPEEAALVLWANSFNAPCTIEELEDGRYQALTAEQISDCPITHQDYQVQVSPDGEVTAVAVGAKRETDVCVGRRPHGLAQGDPCAADQLSFEAEWLADVARLEAAAVVAFAQMVAALEGLGAPRELIERAHTAALDEMRHARGVQSLASTRGARAKPAVVELVKERDVLSFAVENAVEGCVRECWGALLAHYQARAAQDAAVRDLWSQIAEEESAHALLSMDIGAWLSTRLTPAEQDVVEAARQRAVADLFAELAGSEPASPALGLPDRGTRLALMRALEERVLRPLAA